MTPGTAAPAPAAAPASAAATAAAAAPWHRRMMQSLLYGRDVDRARKTRARLGLALMGFGLVYGIIAVRLVLYAVLPDTHAVRRGGSTDAVATARPDIVDRNGKVVESWTQWDHLFAGGRGPHKVLINPYDPDRHVWVVDDERQQIFEFTNDGKDLVLTLGVAGVKGNDDKHFGRPTDIAWLPDGTFFISDGYVNTRVVKFDKNGKYLMTWGVPGKGPGEFRLPHSIAIDARRRVYVADRSNSRIQVFDENGKYLDEWDHIRSPYHIMMTADQHLWVADGQTNKFVKYDLNGKYLNSWGTYGSDPGEFWAVHQFSVDSEGNLYAAETFGGRTQKFVPKKGADPETLIGAPIPLASR